MTSVVDFPDQSAIENEASQWIAKLDGGSLSVSDLRELRRWVNQSSRHRSVLEDMAARWDMLDVLVFTQAADRQATATSHRSWPRMAAMAAAVVLIALTAVFVNEQGGISPELSELDQTTYYTDIGEQKSVTLSDGSVITINTNSRLHVDFSKEERNLSLEQGEAFFEVAKSTRPFKVSAGRGQVVALGTAFAVRLTSSNVVEVDVTEGVVNVSRIDVAGTDTDSPDNAKAQIFNAGDRGRISDSVELIDTVDLEVLERQLSWREGMLVFNGESLEDVILQISRYTPIEFVISDPSLRNLKIGGYFQIGDTEVLLDTLASSFGVEADVVRPELIYLRPVSR